jgi:hypothetical protein
LKAFAPQVAGADFINFSMLVLCILAVNLDIPVEVLLLDSSRGNFANMRGVLMQARLAWQRFQRLQIDCQERPTYLWRVRSLLEERSKRGAKLRQLIAAGGVNLNKHNWHLPEWEYIEPLKDVSAGALELATGQSSPRRVANRQQVDFKQLASEIVSDRSMLIEMAIKEADRLNGLFPDAKIDWRILAPMGIPTGVTMQIATTGEDPKSDAAKPEKKGSSNAA